MNFYKRYTGDYMSKTAHLTLIEHGAYTVLLDHCYSNEEPLPLDIEQCYRIARAFTKEERAAVDSIIKQFFKKTGNGYENDRVLKEVANAQAYADAQAMRAHKRWQMQADNQTEEQGQCPNDASHSHSHSHSHNQTSDNQKPERGADKPPPRKKFVKPTIPEIREYCNQIGATINPSTFFNHYETVGWKVGKNPMKDWQAAVRGWNSREGK